MIRPPFYIMAAVFVIGAAVWLVVDPRKSAL
jgi:hypothetical protein